MINLGKRSQQRMTGLSSDQRIKRAEKRRAEEEKRKAKETAELIKTMVGLPQPIVKEWEIPMPPGPAVSPLMRQLLELERQGERKKKKGWLDKHGG